MMASSRRRFLTTIGAAAAGAGVATAARGTTPGGAHPGNEFMFMGLPLNVARGTGSPANPIAMF